MTYRPGSTRIIEYSSVYGSTALFPRTIIRQLDTDDTVATVDLESVGDGRYRGSYELPADQSELGYFLTETTVPYSDSGHTTPDGSEGIAHQTIQVLEPVQRVAAAPSVAGGRGEAARVDYNRIGNLLRDYMKPLLELLEKRFDTIDYCLNEIKVAVSEIKIPDAVDHREVLKGVSDRIQNAISGVVDLSKQIKAIDKLPAAIDSAVDKLAGKLAKDHEALLKKHGTAAQGIMLAIKEIRVAIKLLDGISESHEEAKQVRKDLQRIANELSQS